MKPTPASILHDIYLREILRLNEKSLEAPLDLREIKSLEMLSKAYSNFRTPTMPEDPEEDLSHLTETELLEIANGTSANPASKAPEEKS